MNFALIRGKSAGTLSVKASRSSLYFPSEITRK